MSFFSWGSQHSKEEDLPMGGSSSPSRNDAAGKEDKQEGTAASTIATTPLSATGPPPTTLGYDMPQQAASSPSPTKPPTTFYNQQVSTTPKRGSTTTTLPNVAEEDDDAPAAATSEENTNVHIFVPHAPSNASSNEDEDSWVETLPMSETGGNKDNEETLKVTHNFNEPTTMMDKNDSPGRAGAMEDYESMSQEQSPVSGSKEQVNEGWEEIHEDPGTGANTGPATLETVEQERPMKTSSPTGEFEWISSPPSDDPTIIDETSNAMTLRKNTPQRNTGAASSAIVIPRGLPPFTKGVKTGLNQLQEKTARRQHEVRTRIHTVECQMARWTANLATERMARQDALQHVLAECVYQPAGLLTERVSQARQRTENQINNPEGKDDAEETGEDEDDETTRRQPRWRSVETRLTALETQMAQSAHALAKDRRLKLLSLHDRLVYEILPRIWKERTESAVQEHLLLERMDKLAGQCAARSLKERAAREVAIITTDEYLQESKGDYEGRHNDLSQALEDIRAELKREQEERQQKDEAIQQQMIEMTTALKNAMLEAVGDPQD